MINLEMNGQHLTVLEGTTLLAMARAAGIDIPTLCAFNGLDHFTSCMVCVVEERGTGRMLPACSTTAAEGMQIATGGPAVETARRAALELLLGDHLGDCEGPCRMACPAGMNIPAMLRAIAAGHLHEALAIVRRDIALPAVLGRICPAPCEKACRRGQHDAPVAICRLKQLVADAGLERGAAALTVPAADSGFRVAVVGAGPAGLAASYALRRTGHAVVLFEKEPICGGGLRAPELTSMLPVDVLNAEVEAILALGVELKTGVWLGRDFDLEALKQQFDAVILAVGHGDADADGSRFGLNTGNHGMEVERHTWRTADPKVFACGDVVRPSRMAARAEGQGHAAAVAVHQMLCGEPLDGLSRGYEHRLGGRPEPEELAVWMQQAAPYPRRELQGRDADVFGDARFEAARCLHCDCHKAESCQLRRYAGMVGADQRAWKPETRRTVCIVRNGGVIYEQGKCIACGICVRLTERAKEPMGFTFVGRGFDVHVGLPFGTAIEEGLQKLATECIAACPTGALAADEK